MSKTGKVLKFEIYKTVKNKFLMISFFVFFAIFLVIVISSAYSFPLKNEKVELTEGEKVEAITYYENARASNELVLRYIRGESEKLPDGIFIVPGIDYQERYDYYDFLLKTRTFENDYLATHEQSFGKAHQGSYIMIEALNKLGIILPIVSILLAFYVLSCDYNSGIAKNLIAAPIERKKIYLGKALFLCLVNLVIFLMAVAFPVFAGLGDKSATLLIYGKSGYYSQSAFAILFFPKASAIIVFMFFYTFTAALLGELFKSKAFALIAPLLVFVGAQLFYFAWSFAIGISGLFNIMPLSHIIYGELSFVINAFSSFSEGWLYLMVAGLLCAIFSALCAIVSAKKIEKQDF